MSSQISLPVVRSWISGLAGLSNCCGIQLLGVEAASSWALAIAPFMPSLAGVSTRFAPKARSRARRSRLIDSGMVSVRSIALGSGHERQGDARVAAGRLDDVRLGIEHAGRFSAASIIARPMRSLTLENGLKNSSFSSTVACSAGISRLSLTRGVLNVVSTMLA